VDASVGYGISLASFLALFGATGLILALVPAGRWTDWTGKR
jgi:hypothetical protein